ncbi:MAG: nucleotidyl transferase AbiEii/AbiGii toxin family protein [bacterium]|nr:nucleotidyl transferase AbiEii/AbiGii toxin family protein [bacterium]
MSSSKCDSPIPGEFGLSLAESVRQRLLNHAKLKDKTFDLVLTHYALERLLYRISQSQWKEKVFLKGALLFSIWYDSPHRATRDLDLLGCGFSSMEYVKRMFHNLCEMSVPDDGIFFDPSTIRCHDIREGNTYHGIRVKLLARLAGARIPLQVDVGFGDSITPEPEYVVYPTFLEFPPPTLFAYTKYTVVAEKFQAMVDLGIANSRMKDFYDIRMMSKEFSFSGAILKNSIQATFTRRGTTIPQEVPFALRPLFSEDRVKKLQWDAFIRKKRVEVSNEELPDIINKIKEFLLPPLAALQHGNVFEKDWQPGGPWRK